MQKMFSQMFDEQSQEKKMDCAVGVMAYNEEANIGKVLNLLLQQKTSSVVVREIFVVASGCTDQTVTIARTFEGSTSPVKVLEQPRREGKASAINLFLQHASASIVVLVNGDNLPCEDTVEKLVQPFVDEQVGMTGGKAVPLNRTDYFMGFAVNLMWNLHHQMAQDKPKLGEVVAWRRSFGPIPQDTAVDEISLELLVSTQGYKLCYQPEAVIYNRGPETVSDFLKQRRRIHAGHLKVLRTQKYRAATLNNWSVVRLLFRSARWERRWIAWTAGTVTLELIGRSLGNYDYLTKKRHTVWQRVASTKNL